MEAEALLATDDLSFEEATLAVAKAQVLATLALSYEMSAVARG